MGWQGNKYYVKPQQNQRIKRLCGFCGRMTKSLMLGNCPGCYMKKRKGIKAAERYLEKLGVDL